MAVQRMFLTLFFLGFSLFSPVRGESQDKPPIAASLDIVRHFNNVLNGVYDKVSPAVVVIEVNRIPLERYDYEKELPPGTEHYFRRNRENKDIPLEPPMEGSGFLIDPKGHILTNAHVLERADPKSVIVRLKDGREFSGKIVGIDSGSDVAVLKIDASDLPIVQIGDSDQVRVGEFALALGAPFDLPDTFSMGVISAKGRDHLTHSPDYENYIQTDASINPGSSGGPLCDIEGRVIGVNTLINGINRGLGFAIPINFANKIAQELIRSGKIIHPWIGIRISSLKDNVEFRPFAKGVKDGVIIEGILKDSPAMKSGLRPGDIIISVNGVPMGRDSELQGYILDKKVGENIEVAIWRHGKMQNMKVLTEALPEPKPNNEMATADEKLKVTAPAYFNFEMLGIQMQDLTPELKKKLKSTSSGGALVTSVDPDGKASQANIRPSDILTEINFQTIHNKAEAVTALEHADPHQNGILVLLERQGEKTYSILK